MDKLRIEEGDFVIISQEKSKKLVRVTNNKGNLMGVEEKTRVDGSEPFQFERADIMAYLGKSPMLGSVYGVKVELFYKTLTHKRGGDIHIYRDMTKEEKQQLKISIDGVFKFFDKHKIDPFPVTTEIKIAQGRWAGMYKYRPKAETDLMVLKPQVFEEASALNLVAHEYGHGIWFRKTSVQTRAAWIKLYLKAVQLRQIDSDEIQRLGEDFISSGSTTGEFGSALGEEDSEVFDKCLEYIEGVHNLNEKHLNTLIVAGEDVKGYWPTEPMDLSGMDLMLTEYAQTSPEEFFAEAFAFHVEGVKLPKEIEKLMKLTVQRAAHHIEESEDDGDEE